MKTILIAGLPGIYKNYEHALIQNGFGFLYPKKPPTDAPFILSELSNLDYDLLLLPGGGDFSTRLYSATTSDCSSYDYITDLLQFQLLQLALLQKKPILGICKGMQMLNVYFGGDLYTHLPTADLHSSQKGDLMHPLFFTAPFPEHCHIWGRHSETASAVYRLLLEIPLANSAHHQGIHKLSPYFLTLQHSEDFLPETIAHTRLPILGLQWHPERLPGFFENHFGKLIDLLLQSR